MPDILYIRNVIRFNLELNQNIQRQPTMVEFVTKINEIIVEKVRMYELIRDGFERKPVRASPIVYQLPEDYILWMNNH